MRISKALLMLWIVLASADDAQDNADLVQAEVQRDKLTNSSMHKRSEPKIGVIAERVMTIGWSPEVGEKPDAYSLITATVPIEVDFPSSAKLNSPPKNKKTIPDDVLHPPLQKVLQDQVLTLAAALKKHNFIFWVDSGTALAAVRDKEVIPYDSDNDIGVFIADWDTEAGDKEFERLLAVNDELENYTIVSTPPHEPHWESFYKYPENEKQKKFYAFSGPKGKDTGARTCLMIFRENAAGKIEQLYPFKRSILGKDIVAATFEKEWIFPLKTAELGGQKVPIQAELTTTFLHRGGFKYSDANRYLDLRPDKCFDEKDHKWKKIAEGAKRCETYCPCA